MRSIIVPSGYTLTLYGAANYAAGNADAPLTLGPGQYPDLDDYTYTGTHTWTNRGRSLRVSNATVMPTEPEMCLDCGGNSTLWLEEGKTRASTMPYP